MWLDDMARIGRGGFAPSTIAFLTSQSIPTIGMLCKLTAQELVERGASKQVLADIEHTLVTLERTLKERKRKKKKA